MGECLKVTLTCHYCKKEFLRYRYELNRPGRNSGKYCSRKCKDLDMIGSSRPKGDSFRKKISDSHKNRDYSKIFTKEVREKMSRSHKGIPLSESHKINIGLCQKGNKSHFWRGDDYCRKYPREFYGVRKEIIKRDGNTCQECSISGESTKGIIDVHHIDYDKNNNKQDNLICLCKSCHSKTNFGRDDWKEYYMEKLYKRSELWLQV